MPIEEIITNRELPAPTGPEATDTEKRTSDRKVYMAIQRVAFHEESQTPDASMFLPVRCRDISTRGIAFFLPTLPVTQFCTVALTQAEKTIYVRCRVAHESPSGNLNGEWLVGCQFLDRSDHLWHLPTLEHAREAFGGQSHHGAARRRTSESSPGPIPSTPRYPPRRTCESTRRRVSPRHGCVSSGHGQQRVSPACTALLREVRGRCRNAVSSSENYGR
jgi:hypothetical protein